MSDSNKVCRVSFAGVVYNEIESIEVSVAMVATKGRFADDKESKTFYAHEMTIQKKFKYS